MKIEKKYLVGSLVAVIVIILSVWLIIYHGNKNISYKWVEETDSTIGQYRLYVINNYGMAINGKVTITYLNGKSEEVEISKDGELYVKSVISDVQNPKKK